KEESFFHPVQDGQLSEFKLTTVRQLRLDPLFSPNTGEFLVTLAAPWADKADSGHDKMKATHDKTKAMKVLATKFESLFNPVLPAGYGYAIVGPDAKVLFHSSSVRNMNEDFAKEARGNPALLAALAQGTTDYLPVRYLGTDKKLWVTPLDAPRKPRLTLMVFKDSSHFTTANMAVVVVFAVLIAIYAILPSFLIVLVHILRRKQYPLDLIWPARKAVPFYLRVGATNFLLSMTFFFRYAVYGPGRTLIAVLAVVSTGALYPFWERRQRWRFAGNLAVLAVLVWLSGLSWVLVFAAAFAVYAFLSDRDDRAPRAPRAPAFNFLLPKQPSLKYTYTLVAVSLLLVLVVVPGLGFFKVAHDYVHRLFLQSQQLNLASRLAERNQVIDNYYSHLKAEPSFKTRRLEETSDRYDHVFLNCPANNLDLSRARELHATFLERAILYLTDRFPVDPVGARLQELGRTEKDPPDFKWKVSEQTVNCPAGAPTGGSLLLIGPGEPIVSPYPSWRPKMRALWLGAVVLGLALWIHFVAGRLFLLDMERLPPLEKWQPKGGESSRLCRYILLLGHPKSGKQLAVRKLAGIQLIDFAEMATTGKWEIPALCSDLVALLHFEFGIDNADINMNKLRILEDLMHVQQKRIILLSTVDPLYYLTAGSPDIVVSGEKKDPATATQLLDRWAVVLSPFRKVMIEDITVARFCKRVSEIRRRRPEPEFNAF